MYLSSGINPDKIARMRRTLRAKTTVIDVRRYGGTQVVVYHNRVVANGETAREALRKAQEKYPRVSLRELRVFSVPETVRTVYVF